MNKKKINGFTLVELLAVIVVLGIILTVAIPNIIGIISQAKIDACEKQKDLIIDSARKYVLQNGNSITWTSNTATIYLSDLQTNNILPNPLKNPIGGNFDNTTSGVNITVTRNGNDYGYTINNAFCYVDNTKPVITLNGSSPLNINQGDIYNDAGATATDNIDGDITSKIVTVNNVNPFIPGTYTVTYNVTDNMGNVATEVTRTVNVATSDYLASKGVNKPRLITGMTPIKWNGSTWVDTTESDTDWYSYSTADKKWANARTADGSMWVWIPRYAYQIVTNYHLSNVGTINIKFLKNNTNTASDNTTVATTPTYSGSSQTNYIQHLAFTFGTTEVTGIWIAKFEARINTNEIESKPDLGGFWTSTISDVFTATRNMETKSRYGWGTTGTGLDTHMAKNTEWVAAVYLAQSAYGKNAEVWPNCSNTYRTGYSGTSVSSAAGCTLYAYNTGNGQQGSTTGNVYGIYDMSGGADEYVAAYVSNGHANLTAYGSSIINANAKYKDVYSAGGIGTTDEQLSNYNLSMSKKSDAVFEVSSSYDGFTSWNTDYSIMPYGYYPFFARGGGYLGGVNSGTFGFNRATGGSSSIGGGDGPTSFRPVILIDSGL